MSEGMRLNIGGLMRCCTATAGESELSATVQPDGTELHCKWCKDGVMVAKGGIWWWSGIPEAERTYTPLPDDRKRRRR
jgi:hypothetical protein